MTGAIESSESGMEKFTGFYEIKSSKEQQELLKSRIKEYRCKYDPIGGDWIHEAGCHMVDFEGKLHDEQLEDLRQLAQLKTRQRTATICFQNPALGPLHGLLYPNQLILRHQ